jgi:hypothetical protein
MSLGEGGGSELDFETMEGRDYPSITQFSVFLENRVGKLLELARIFQGSKVKIVGLSIADSADCCIVRLVLSHPEQGRELLELADLAFAENDLVVVELHHGPPSLVEVCTALIQAELNIHYAYPLIVHPLGRSALALHVDNVSAASATLRDKGFELLCEADLTGA